MDAFQQAPIVCHFGVGKAFENVMGYHLASFPMFAASDFDRMI